MNQDDLIDLIEVRQEIRRINQAAMRTIFNPAATEALEKLIKKVTASNDQTKNQPRTIQSGSHNL